MQGNPVHDKWKYRKLCKCQKLLLWSYTNSTQEHEGKIGLQGINITQEPLTHLRREIGSWALSLDISNINFTDECTFI